MASALGRARHRGPVPAGPGIHRRRWRPQCGETVRSQGHRWRHSRARPLPPSGGSPVADAVPAETRPSPMVGPAGAAGAADSRKTPRLCPLPAPSSVGSPLQAAIRIARRAPGRSRRATPRRLRGRVRPGARRRAPAGGGGAAAARRGVAGAPRPLFLARAKKSRRRTKPTPNAFRRWEACPHPAKSRSVVCAKRSERFDVKRRRESGSAPESSGLPFDPRTNRTELEKLPSLRRCTRRIAFFLPCVSTRGRGAAAGGSIVIACAPTFFARAFALTARNGK